MQKKKLTPLQIVGHVLHTAILGVLAVVMAVLLFAANVILPGYARMVTVSYTHLTLPTRSDV